MNGSLKNRKSLAIIMIITIVAAAVMGISISSCQKEETISIGAILSITGPGFQSGGDLRDAMLLAVEEINSRGGMNKKKIKLIIENPEVGEKMIKSGKRYIKENLGWNKVVKEVEEVYEGVIR